MGFYTQKPKKKKEVPLRQAIIVLSTLILILQLIRLIELTELYGETSEYLVVKQEIKRITLLNNQLYSEVLVDSAYISIEKRARGLGFVAASYLNLQTK